MTRSSYLFATAAVMVCAFSAAPAGAQGISVALTPAGQQVAPGATFTLDITVPNTGSSFNGFDAVIGYDPAALTLLPASPTSLQQGTLMTGACGNTFHRFREGASTDTIADVLLCGGISLTGPGQLYRLQFRASTTAQVTAVRFQPGLQFYNVGLYVNPVHSSDAMIGIGMPPPVGVAPGATVMPLGLRITPNPARSGAMFTLESDRAGPQKVGVFDVQGRQVRMYEDSETVAGTRHLAWDGLDDAGRAVAPGIYLVTFEVAGRAVSNRLALIR